MAYLSQDDQQNQNGQNQAQGQAQGQGQGQAAPSLGGDSAFGGSGGKSSTMPGPAQGQGGGDGWTNIQNYLTANAGNNSSAGLLNQNASSAVNSDRSQFDNQASQYKKQGQQQVAGVNQDQASQLLGQATSQYGQGSGYQGIVSQLQGMINNGYSGPKAGDFSYGISGGTQQLGQAVGGNQGAFNSYMNGIYQSAAGPMTQGSKALQSQLDSGNGALQSARQNALSQYNGLNDYVSGQSQAVNSELGQDQSQYAQNQQGVKDYLGTTATGDQSAINSQIQRDNSYLQNLASGANQFNMSPFDPRSPGYTPTPGNTMPGGAFINGGIFSNDPRNQDFLYTFKSDSGPNQNNVAGVDSQRNNYNTIQDVLGSGSKIAQQGAWDPRNAQFNREASLSSNHADQGGTTLGYGDMMGAAGNYAFAPTTYQQILNYLNQPYSPS